MIENLKKYCLNFEYSLMLNGRSDIDGLDLYFELNVLREIVYAENDTVIELLNQIMNGFLFQIPILIVE